MSSAAALQISSSTAFTNQNTGSDAAPQATAQHAAPQKDSSITELVFTRHSPDDNQLLLPMLAHFSRMTNRWITWIVSSPVDGRELAEYGVDTGKLRIIYSRNTADTRWMTWEALNNGTSHTVIATPGHINSNELTFLKQASRNGGSHGLLIHYR